MSFPIVFATDKNYIVPTYMAVSSLLTYIDRRTDIEIFILCAEIDKDKKEYFYALSDKIQFVEVKMSDLHLNKKLNYISIATYYRFLIPKLLKGYSKCLYLDSDIIIKQDISPLLSEPIENYTLMGVRNYFIKERDPVYYNQRRAECSLDNLDTYINAGVLLMNLDRLRENDLYQIMIDDAHQNTYEYNDQDILNKYCKNNIGLVSVKYNFMVHYLKNMSVVSKKIDEDIESISNNPVIVHYSTKFKPWKYKGYLMANLWYEEICHIVFKKAKLELIKPFIKDCRMDCSWKERTIDKLKFVYRKYIAKNFACTTQRCLEG